MEQALSHGILDAARRIGVCRSTIYNLINDGKLDTVKVGRRTLIKAESLRKLVDA